MQDIKIALIQHNSPVRAKEANLAETINWTKKAKKKGAQLVLFPELNITGHAGCPDVTAQAESLPDGPSVQKLTQLAAQLDIYICAGIAEDDLGVFYNTQFIVGPQGYIGKQRKIHLSGDEYFFFRHGSAMPVLTLPFARIGMIICADNSVPEVARCLAVKAAELLLCPHASRFGAWPKDPARRRKWITYEKDLNKMTHRSRANDNGVFVALTNAAGRAAMGIRGVEANHAGGCLIIDPFGEIVAESKRKDIGDEMVIAKLKGSLITKKRRPGFNLQVRKPEFFKVLGQITD